MALSSSFYIVVGQGYILYKQQMGQASRFRQINDVAFLLAVCRLPLIRQFFRAQTLSLRPGSFESTKNGLKFFFANFLTTLTVIERWTVF